MKMLLSALCSAGLLLSPALTLSQVAAGSMNVHWREGSKDCKANTDAPLQVHPYNPQTFILRENLCATFEGPFMYLLVGSTRALLIDTGDVADPKQMPLAETVLHLLPGDGPSKLPLLVVHTHRHLDHRAGDEQFAHLPNVQLVGFDLESVRHFYNFTNWPNGTAQIDLGNRIVDAIPTPGHNETEVTFYDRNTALLFSGDFLMPARLLIDDTQADLVSAQRIAAFVQDRPVSYVLGGHIELDETGNTFPWESTYHPNEHVLQLTKSAVLALPAAVSSFNGFYTITGGFVMMNSMRILIAFAAGAGVLLLALIVLLIRFLVRRRNLRRQRATA